MPDTATPEATIGDPSESLQPKHPGRDVFVAKYGEAFRNGRWVAERAWSRTPDANFADPAQVYIALRNQFRDGTFVDWLSVIEGYDALDPRVEAATLVSDECQALGIDAMTAEQHRRMLTGLAGYQRRFGFGAIFALRDYTTASLLESLESRVKNDHGTELRIIQQEIERLAQMRVAAAFQADTAV